MQRFFLRVVIALLTCLLGVGASMGWAACRQRGEVLDTLNDFHGALLRRDAEALDGMLAEGFVLHSAKGRVNKPTLLASLRSGELEPCCLSTTEVRISVAGSEATVTGGFTELIGGGGTGGSGSVRFIYSFERRQGKWQLASVRPGK